MLHVAVGLSIILGFLSAEFLGLASGGLISAGYLAFYLEQPLRLASTILLALLVLGIVKLLQTKMIIYGRRRFMICVILGLIGAWAIEQGFYLFSGINQDMRIIGFVVPGLIANDMAKQGIWKTLVMILLISALVRLLLMTGIF